MVRWACSWLTVLKHLAALAAENSRTRFVWQVLDRNATAIEFYEAHGPDSCNRATCRIEGDAIRRLAGLAD